MIKYPKTWDMLYLILNKLLSFYAQDKEGHPMKRGTTWADYGINMLVPYIMGWAKNVLLKGNLRVAKSYSFILPTVSFVAYGQVCSQALIDGKKCI